MSKENLKDTMGSLFDGMEGFLTSKTVVGEPIYIKDTIILPLVDVSFGMGAGAFSGDKKDKSGGGIGGKMTPSAVLVIKDGQTKLVNIKNQETIVKKYSPGSMVIGEAPLMNDLETVTNVDLRNVNIASIAAIFVIILIVFKSISLPVILVAVIEFAICVNMAVPYYTGLSLPFVASIVIGTIQLGATVDYAILMTSRYQKERINGKKKMEAIRIAHETSMQSIITSGLSFFAATIGIAIYSNIDMISAICTLLARGAVISTVAVIFILPAMFMIFDKLICKTTLKMGHLE